jgi:SpoVK/Ycf46/Vps4 family AAA+-type ATPase
LKDIVFDDMAFNKLVLPATKKSLIKALVEDYRQGVELLQNITKKEDHKHLKRKAPKELDQDIAEINEVSAKAKLDPNSRLFTDIITGKGGGCIFLLHGSPGVGKTLTAEAVCEHLHIPLYSITVGELGTTPEALESQLQAILELSGLWGAGILLDEADIFLEKRSKKDILRNAMVGIFLRLLEYHNGVLFLTTNRLSCLDEAFSSRISVALHYHDLGIAARAQIWENFLQATVDSETYDTLSIEQLAAFELNGRQIRSCVRLSCARARIEQIPLSMEHLLNTVHLTRDFRTQFVDEKYARKGRRRAKFENTVAVKIDNVQ